MAKGLAVTLVLLTAGVSANAATIAYWHFNDTHQLGGSSLWRIVPLGTPENRLDYASDLGDGTAEISVWGADPSDGNLSGTNGTDNTNPINNFGSYTGTTVNAQGGADAGGSLAILGPVNNDRYFVIQLDDAISGAALSYATRGTSTGAKTHTLHYSTNGGQTWTFLESHAAEQTVNWVVHTVVLGDIFANSSGPEMNLIRMTLTGATGTSGNNRFDNILITGEIVPEPATLALLALGLPLIRRRR